MFCNWIPLEVLLLSGKMLSDQVCRQVAFQPRRAPLQPMEQQPAALEPAPQTWHIETYQMLQLSIKLTLIVNDRLPLHQQKQSSACHIYSTVTLRRESIIMSKIIKQIVSKQNIYRNLAPLDVNKEWTYVLRRVESNTDFPGYMLTVQKNTYIL